MRLAFFRKKIWRQIFLGFSIFFLVGLSIGFPASQILAADETGGPVITLGVQAEIANMTADLQKTLCDSFAANNIPAPQCSAINLFAKRLKLGFQRAIPLLQASALNLVVTTSQYVLDRLAYDAAVWVATGGEGETSLFTNLAPDEAWRTFGLDVAANAVTSLSKDLSDYLDTDFNLCAPANPLFRIGMQIGVVGIFQPPKPICDWQSIANNWTGFYQTIASTAASPSEAMLNAVAKGLQPGQNTLSYFVQTNIRIKQEVQEKKGAFFQQYLKDDNFQNISNIVTGHVETPAVFVREHLSTQINEAKNGNFEAAQQAAISNVEILPLFLTHTTSVFVNTLLSTWLSKLKTGLFPSDLGETDVFDEMSINTNYGEAAEEFYSDVLATTPMSLDNYNVLSEFVICPGADSRQMNNCVMDSSFASAILQSGSTDLMTVAKAVEQGLLNGNRPLYSPDDSIHNQDAQCYTYGYCYSNLVKLRKARIIPVGWEMAAASPRNSSTNPITLREVIDGFNDCNNNGQLDAEHPWCHLIDPSWVLKYPTQECLASMISEQTISPTMPGRSGACVDAPSCVAENDDGSCGGYGYCTREKNTWNFSGDDCPEEFATCLAFTNSDTSERGAWLFNSLDQGVCSADSAGCAWYRTNKHLDNANTTDDTSDDSYEWLAGDDTYLTANREDDVLSYNAAGVPTNRTTYYYDTGDDGVRENSYETYAYEDRVYFTSDVQSCTEESVGCAELYKIEDNFSLNVLRNPSFENNDIDENKADYWIEPTVPSTVFDYIDDSSSAKNGNRSYKLGAERIGQTNIQLQQNTFYNISFYAKSAELAGAVTARFYLSASDNQTVVDLTGYSSDCDRVAGNQVDLEATNISSTDFQSFDCTFTTPSFSDSRLRLSANLFLLGQSNSAPVYVDAIQLEARETPSTFHEGYNQTALTTDYLKVPPVWLDCQGEATDPTDCESYATVCSATDVDCSLYSPADNDPDVPAILAEEDQCPSECVGYTSYKQEDSAYDAGEYPLYFIADTADSCTLAQVGCDEFTNLETEAVQNFSYLRACVTQDMTTDEAVYFTWEGSDNTGYQLVSYQLLETDLDSETVTYSQDTDNDGTIDSLDNDDDGDGISDTAEATTDSDQDGIYDTDDDYNDLTSTEDVYERDVYNVINDSYASSAPCVNWQVESGSSLVCHDSLTEIEDTDECNEHEDIFSNPDCREFYDVAGQIHYRLYSETVSITDDCTAFRKTDSNSEDCAASGGYYTTAGECRYFVYPAESTSCSAPGCREYTGGGSRNSSAIFTEYFENGNYDNFESTASLSISNESVAVDGHSLRVVVTSATDDFVQTQQDYTTNQAECSDSAGCVSANSECVVAEGDIGCGALNDSLVAGKTYLVKFWAKGTGSLEVSMIDNGGVDGLHHFDGSVTLTSDWRLYELGPLDTSNENDFGYFDENAVLAFYPSVVGQIFYLDNIELEQTEEDLTLVKDSWVTPSTCDQTPDEVDSAQYYLGCEEYTDQNNETFNIYQFTDLCSEAAVGCSAYYASQNSSSEYSQLFNLTCYNADGADADTEPDTVTEATACTMDSEEVCTIIAGYNNCQFDYEGNLPVPLPVNIVLGPEAVYVPADEIKYFIASDDFSCTAENKGCTEAGEPTYSQDKTRVESFEAVYLLNQPDNYDDVLCSNEELFCAEWASTEDGNFYFKNPGDKACEYKTGVSINNVSYDGWFRTGTSEFCYGTGTCSVNGNLCSEAANCSDGGEVCQIGVGSVCSVTGAACDSDTPCAQAAGSCVATGGNYIINGDFSGIWLNGDDDYAGWAATCQSQYDLCSEFIDPLDTREGRETDGQSYYYLDNEKIDDAKLNASDRCNNQAGLQEGCVLLNDTMDTELIYSSSPSYLVSEHADLFFGEDPRSLQDPVSCDNSAEEGIYTTTTGTAVNVCQQRCAYDVAFGYEIANLPTVAGPTNPAGTRTKFFGAACVYDSDCQLGLDSVGNEVDGACLNLDIDENGVVDTNEKFYGPASSIDLSPYVFADDTNRVIKVYRDRECAEWLSCSGSYTAWDEKQSKWVEVCQEFGLCDSYNVSGGGGFCNGWVVQDPLTLNRSRYSARDVSWYGLDYAGYSIPDQLPVEFYEQINLAPEGYCTNLDAIDIYQQRTCESFDDCVAALPNDYQYWNCTPTDEISSAVLREAGLRADDYYLVYNVAICDEANGQECTAGYCTDNGNACSSDEECANGTCIVGYCMTTDSDTSCDEDADCTLLGDFSICFGGHCVWDQSDGTCTTVRDCNTARYPNSGTINTTCQPGALAKTGTCYNNSCLVDIDGEAFNENQGVDKSCRGYPEIDAPFPLKVVEFWLDPLVLATGEKIDENVLIDGTINTILNQVTAVNDPDQFDVEPYDYIYGFDDANFCSPVQDVPDSNTPNLFDDCDCSYEKAEYGSGLAKRYYPLGTVDGVMPGICSGGLAPGSSCSTDTECNEFNTDGTSGNDAFGTGGVCSRLTRQDSVHGWDGYCLEKDSASQLYGSTDSADRPCLTWLPINQLVGSRDMYANALEAGFGITDSTYYCTEIALYADLYPTGVSINTSDGSVSDMSYACAASNTNIPGGHGDTGRPDRGGCYYGLYGAANAQTRTCQNNAYCPEGYAAIMGTCNQDTREDDYQVETMYPYTVEESDVPWPDLDRSRESAVNDPDWYGTTICHDDAGYITDVSDWTISETLQDNVIDCPYFCIPLDSYHISGEDAGEFCETDLESLKQTYGMLNNPDNNGDKIGSEDSRFDTPVVTAIDLFNLQDSAVHNEGSSDWSWAGTDENSDFYSVKTKFQDCVKRGVPVGFADYATNPNEAARNVSDNHHVAGISGRFYAFGTGYENGSYGVAYLPINSQIGSCTVTHEICYSDTGCPDLSSNTCECSEDFQGNCAAPGTCSQAPLTSCTSNVQCPTTQTCYSGSNININIGSFIPYVGCYELAEVSGVDSGNKAWTNRLWNGASPMYETTTDGFSVNYGYNADSSPTAAGRALFSEYFTSGTMPEFPNDAWPLPVGTCGSSGSDIYTTPPGIPCTGSNYTYPNQAQYDDGGTMPVDHGGEFYALVTPYEEWSEDASPVGNFMSGLYTSGNYSNGVHTDGTYDTAGSSRHTDPISITGLLQQLFAKVHNIYQYDWNSSSGSSSSANDTGGGAYVAVGTGIINRTSFSADISNVGDDYGFATSFDGEPTVPKVSSVGVCFDSNCLEQNEGKFSVNGVDAGVLQFSGGSVHLTVNFFAWADSDQMPIRDVTVDWGDGDHADSSLDWPTDSQSGTRGAGGSYYRNHRGLEAQDELICGSEDNSRDEWGFQSDACETAYFSFEKDYYCSKTMVDTMESDGIYCEWSDDDGPRRLLNSPCIDDSNDRIITEFYATDSCVFQPRVHVKDNWGWCTGYCDSNPDTDHDGLPEEETDGCYNTECQTDICPGGEDCPDFSVGTDNPWINFDGLVIVDWEN
ncbi:MAG: hypothetical protein V1664_05215 [Candidatus Uhrbacteria bacterium]